MAVYYKMRQMLLQNAVVILLQNATEALYKMRQVFYCKFATIITNCNNFITKSNRYYKMRRLLEIATVHPFTYLNLFINVLQD